MILGVSWGIFVGKPRWIWEPLNFEMHLDIWLWHKIGYIRAARLITSIPFLGQSFWATAICLRELMIGHQVLHRLLKKKHGSWRNHPFEKEHHLPNLPFSCSFQPFLFEEYVPCPPPLKASPVSVFMPRCLLLAGAFDSDRSGVRKCWACPSERVEDISPNWGFGASQRWLYMVIYQML